MTRDLDGTDVVTDIIFKKSDNGLINDAPFKAGPYLTPTEKLPN